MLTKKQIHWLMKRTVDGWLEEIEEQRELLPTDYSTLAYIKILMEKDKESFTKKEA